MPHGRQEQIKAQSFSDPIVFLVVEIDFFTAKGDFNLGPSGPTDSCCPKAQLAGYLIQPGQAR